MVFFIFFFFCLGDNKNLSLWTNDQNACFVCLSNWESQDQLSSFFIISAMYYYWYTGKLMTSSEFRRRSRKDLWIFFVKNDLSSIVETNQLLLSWGKMIWCFFRDYIRVKLNFNFTGGKVVELIAWPWIQN